MSDQLAAREFTDSVYWVGACRRMVVGGQPVHNHHSAFLIVGLERTLLVDTSSPGFYPELEAQLTAVLGDRPLDLIVPTHPEVAHAGNLPLLLARYPQARLAGDVRDYHLFFPDLVGRFDPVPVGAEIDLGGGFAYVVLPAPIRDLPGTVWGYERRTRVMFVGDGFGYVHRGSTADGLDMPIHTPAECRLLSHELGAPPSVELTEHVTRQALDWSRYVDATAILDEVDRLLERYPPAMIAPAHGNVISDPETVWPVIRSSFERAFRAETAASARY